MALTQEQLEQARAKYRQVGGANSTATQPVSTGNARIDAARQLYRQSSERAAPVATIEPEKSIFAKVADFGDKAYTAFTNIPGIKTLSSATGSLTGGFGEGLAIVGTQTVKPILKQALVGIRLAKGDTLTEANIKVDEIIKREQAKSIEKTTELGRQSGEAGLPAAIVGGGAGTAVNALLAYSQGYKGLGTVKEGLKTGDYPLAIQGGIELATAFVGAKQMAGELKSGKNLLISKELGQLVGMSKTTSGKIKTYVDKGIKPYFSNKTTAGQRDAFYKHAEESIKVISEKPTSFVNEKTGIAEVRTPRSRAELLDAIGQTKKALYKQYHSSAVQAGEQGVSFDATRAIAELTRVSTDLKFSPEVRQYARRTIRGVRELQGQSPEIIEERIKDYNNSAYGIKIGRVGQAKAQVDISIANFLREELDNRILNEVGGEYQKIRSQYGSLKTIERDVARQVNVEARKGDKGLLDFTDIFTGGDIFSGVLTANPAQAAKGVFGLALKTIYKKLNDPNRFIRLMFEEGKALPENVYAPKKPFLATQEPSIVPPSRRLNAPPMKPQIRDTSGLLSQDAAKARLQELGVIPQSKRSDSFLKDNQSPTVTQQSKNVNPVTIEEHNTEIARLVENFRKEAGLMADREGAGVTYRAVKDGVDETMWMAKGFKLNKAKASMKAQSESAKRYGEQMLFDNSPSFRELVMKRDYLMATKIDEAKTAQQLANEVDPFLDVEIKKIETYETLPSNAETPNIPKVPKTPPSSETKGATGKGLEGMKTKQ